MISIADIPDTPDGGIAAAKAGVAGYELFRARKFIAWQALTGYYAGQARKYTPPWSDEKRARFIELWNSDVPTHQISAEFEITDQAVWTARKRLGLPHRDKTKPENWRNNFDAAMRERMEANSIALDILLVQERREREAAIRAERERLRDEKRMLSFKRSEERQRIREMRLAECTERQEAAQKREEELAASRSQRRLRAARVILLYGRGETIDTIKSKVGCTFSYITDILKEHGFAKPRERIWTTEEISILRELASQGTSLDECAKLLRRTAKEIEEKSEQVKITELTEKRHISGMAQNLSKVSYISPKRSGNG